MDLSTPRVISSNGFDITESDSPCNVLFIDRINYKRLQNKTTSVSDICTAITAGIGDVFNSRGVENAANILSESTLSFIVELNKYVFKTLEGITPRGLNRSETISTNESVDSDSLASVKDYFDSVNKTGIYQDQVQSYEIITLSDRTSAGFSSLVVVGDSFLKVVTESKDALLEFVLNCLESIDSKGLSSSRLMELYCRVTASESYFDLIIKKS